MSVTPTAASVVAFAVEADGFHARDFNTSGRGETAAFSIGAVTAVGEASAAAANLNKPLKLSGGEEVEYVCGANSLWVGQYGYAEFPGVKRIGETADPLATNPRQVRITEERAAFFAPNAKHADLAPLKTRARTFRITEGGVEKTVTATIRGAAGLATQRAVSAVALDADGDPVAFRFDRPHQVGRAPDGRPFVVARDNAVRLLSNDGATETVTITADQGKVARWRGAELLVVPAAGRIPIVVHDCAMAVDYARAAGLGPHDFAGWPTTPGSGGTLALVAQFESLHVYFQRASASAAQVRFRKAGTSEWFPAQPLVHDDRDASAIAVTGIVDADSATGTPRNTTVAETTPGNHRGVILFLAPDTTYEVEIAQDGAVFAGSARTKTYKPSKASAALGTVDGLVEITRAGEIVTVTRNGQTALTIDTTGKDYAEIHSGLVRGGTVHVNAGRIILRDVDVIRPPRHCIRLGPYAHDVRIVRGRFAGWGKGDAEEPKAKTTSVGWCEQLSAVVSMNETTLFDGYFDKGAAPNPRLYGNRDVAMIGMQVGSPRYPANTWHHYNPSVGTTTPGTGTHPYGANFVSQRTGSFRGGLAVIDCAVDAHRLRPLEDFDSSPSQDARIKQGWGPNFFIGYTFIHGVVDDNIEIEGPDQCAAVVGLTVDFEEITQESFAPVSVLGAEPVWWGPLVATRVSAVRQIKPDAYSPPYVSDLPFGQPHNSLLKNDRDGDAAQTGRILISHCTLRGSNIDDNIEFLSPGPMQYTTARNLLVRMRNTFSTPADVGAVWGTSNDVTRWSSAAGTLIPYVEDTVIPASFANVDAAEFLANVNDGGPWASAAPKCGAAKA